MSVFSKQESALIEDFVWCADITLGSLELANFFEILTVPIESAIDSWPGMHK